MADQAIGTAFDTQTWNGAAGKKPILAAPATAQQLVRSHSMSSLDVARMVGFAILTAAVVLGGLYLLWQARYVVGWFVGGCVIAVALEPAVQRMQKYHLKRSTAILLVYAALVVIVIGLMALLLPLLIDQIRGLATNGRELMSHPEQGYPMLVDFANRYGLAPYLPRLNEWLQSVSGQLTVVAGGFLSYVTGLFNRMAALASMLFIAYYLLLDGRRLITMLLRRIPQAQQPRVRRILDHSAEALSGYILGNLTISVICGAAVFMVLILLEMPYPGALALIVAILDLIPEVGATLGGAGLVIAGLFVSPYTSLILLGYFIVYQQVENYLLQPLVYSRRVHLHPLTIFIAVVLGGIWLGIAGALLAIPAAEILRYIAVEWLASRAEKSQETPVQG